MANDSVQALSIMADTVYTWLETNAATYNAGFEYLPETSPALMQQSQTTDPVVKRYRSGRTLYRYQFALWLRMDNSDTKSRISAQRDLQKIANDLTAASLSTNDFDVYAIEQDTTARVMQTEENTDVCMIQLHIDYGKKD